jgi:hypothetical protein
LEEASHGKELFGVQFFFEPVCYNLTFLQIANPAFHRSMPVKLFGRLSEKMMLKFEKEGDGLKNVDVPNFLQR